MKKIVFLLLLVGVTQSLISWASYDRFATPAEQEAQLKIEEVQRQLQRAEIDRRVENEAREAAKQASEAAEQAEQAAEELRNEMLRSSIRTKNNTYLGVALLSISGFFIYLMSRRNREKPMDGNQKYGIVTMLVSFLLILLALMISEGGYPQLDYLQNFMNLLRIRLIEIKTENASSPLGYDYSYLIVVRSKYVVLALLSTAAYGLTTYLDITPAFRPWREFTGKPGRLD